MSAEDQEQIQAEAPQPPPVDVAPQADEGDVTLAEGADLSVAGALTGADEALAEDLLVLPGQLDTSAVESLRDEIMARRGQPMMIDASEVGFVGGLVAQLLAVSQKTWQAEGLAFEYTETSEAFVNGMARLGIDAQSLTEEE